MTHRNIICYFLFTFIVVTISFAQHNDHHEYVDLDDQVHEEEIHYENVYNLDWKKRELLTLGSGVAVTVLGQFAINNSEESSLEGINNLTSDDINFLDRGSVGNFSSSAREASDLILYTSATLPFLSYFSSKCRAEGGPIGVMIAETFLLTYGLTNVSKGLVNRYRPYNYNADAPLELKLGEESRRSFVSGHTSNATALSFLAARILTDVHTDFEKKIAIWSVAATVPAVVGYLRVKAGRHFPTDVIGGYVLGATIGYLIPEMHLNKNLDLYVSPAGGVGMSLQF